MDESYSKLRSALSELLADQEHHITLRDQDESSLLVLETRDDSAGFAIVNGMPEQTFSSAYNSFKYLYRENHESWRERNLSFVVCRSDSTREEGSQAFFSRIEADVYFCRKYVVGFPEESQGLEDELRRLPFVPMSRDHPSGLPRLPSAIDFLQSLRIDARITRHLIEPRLRGAHRLLDDFLSHPQNLPNHPAPGAVRPSSPSDLDITRITQLSIEGFRAYGRREELDLDADVVVLYGPNGLGKTSLFDAIDFACTGRIGRLSKGRLASNTEFSRLASHQPRVQSPGRVELKLICGSSSLSVSRDLNDRNRALVGDERLDRGRTLQRLTSASWEEKRERIENLERLFRATHFFSQTSPELFTDFAQTSTLSSTLVARSLALEDYARGIWKVKEVLRETKDQTKSLKNSLFMLREEIALLRKRAEPFRRATEQVEPRDQLKELTRQLVRDLKDDASLNVDADQVSCEDIREWRAIVDGQLRDERHRGESLVRLRTGWTGYRKGLEVAEGLLQRRSDLEALVEKRTATERALKEKKERLSPERDQTDAALEEVRVRLRSLKELVELQKLARATEESLQRHREKLVRLETEEVKAEAEINNLRAKVEARRREAKTLEKETASRRGRIRLLKDVSTGISEWQAAVVATATHQASAGKAESTAEELSTPISDLRKEIADLESRLEATERDYESLTQGQEKLTRILNELETFREGSICPACGTDHGTKASLLERMSSRKEARSPQVDEVMDDLRHFRSSLEHKRKSLSQLERKRRDLEEEREHSLETLAQGQNAVEVFEAVVEKAGLAAEGEDLPKEVRRCLAEEQSGLRAAQDKLETLADDESEAMQRIEELIARESAVEQEHHRESAGSLEEQIVELRAKASDLGVSLDMNADSLADEQRMLSASEGSLEKHRLSLVEDDAAISKRLSGAQSKLRTLDHQLETLKEDQRIVSNELTKYETLAKSLVDVGVESLTEEYLREAVLQTEERQNALESLRRRAGTLEQILDSVQRSAALAQLDADLLDRSGKQSEREAQVESLNHAVVWFTRIREILERKNASAIESHVEAIGPLTTLIQKRLRSVYGFGDISLRAEKEVIEVGIEDWSGEDVRPTDYFSESQKQILMLSLFLSTRLTQTWSGFGAVFMDDPVTHFDDINAFAFAELIRGLVSSGRGRHQFIISTCDERLFGLMKKKLGKSAGSAKFYLFEGLGAKGPVISEVY